MPVDFSVTNQLASPAIYASSFATRPAASFKGRLFVDTDNPSSGIYRDTGTAWIAIAGTSVGEIQSLNDVCVVGNNTSSLGILIFGQSAFGENNLAPYGQMPPFGDYALTIGGYSEFAQSLYVKNAALFDATVQVNENLTTPILIGGDTTTSTLTYKTTTAVGITGARHIFQVGNDGATEAMTILNNGNILIGTTTDASFKLNVNGTGMFSGALSGTSASFSGNGSSFGSASVGSYPLTVQTNISEQSIKFIGKNDNNNIQFFNSANTVYQAVVGTIGTDFIIGTGTSGTTRLTIASTGAATFNSSVTLGNFTTTQINALTPNTGMVVFNTTLETLCFYDGTNWKKVSHSAM